MKKSIAILTSGGDAPGMNNAVVAATKQAWFYNYDVYFIYDGYKGLIEGNLKKATPQLLDGKSNQGGTFLGSARLPEFAEIEVRKKAVEILNKKGIGSLIVIGGDGSYMGAAKLAEMGIKTIGLPGTIDNDIACTDWTIGFDTALNRVVNEIEIIKDTARSHNRLKVIEAMGRYCGDLAIYAGLATQAEVLSVPESKLSEEEIIQQVKKLKGKKRPITVLVTEHLYNISKLASRIEKETGIEARSQIIGYTQRGGIPTAKDKYLATILAQEAVERIEKNESGICLAMVNEKVKSFDILKAVKMKNKNKEDLISKARLLGRN